MSARDDIEIPDLSEELTRVAALIRSQLAEDSTGQAALLADLSRAERRRLHIAVCVAAALAIRLYRTPEAAHAALASLLPTLDDLRRQG